MNKHLKPDDLITCGAWNQDNLLFVIWIVLLVEATALIVMLLLAYRSVRLSSRWKRQVKPEFKFDTEPGTQHELHDDFAAYATAPGAYGGASARSLHDPASAASLSSPLPSTAGFATLPTPGSLQRWSEADAINSDSQPALNVAFDAQSLPATTEAAEPVTEKEPPSPSLVYPVYFKLLIIAIVTIILRALILRYVTPLVSVVWATVQFGVVNGYVAMVRDGIAMFLVQGSAGSDAVTRALCLAIFWGLTIGGVFSALFADSQASEYLNTPLYLWMGHDMAVLCVHFLCLVLWFRPSNERGRTAKTWIFSLALCVIYVMYTISNVLLVQNIVPAAGCFNLLTQTLYYVTWPPLAYFVLRLDSNYWRNLGITPIHDYDEKKRIKGVGRAGTSRAIVDYLSPLLSSSDQENGAPQHKEEEPSRIIDFSHLQLHECLGIGATAHVFRAELLGKREPVAVKRFHLRSLTRKIIEGYIREVAISAKLAHPNIVRLFGVSVNVPSLSIVMEFMQEGHLMQWLSKQRKRYDSKNGIVSDPGSKTVDTTFIPQSLRVRMCLDLCRAVAFLHSQQPAVLHLDIKSLNILVSSTLTLKLTDFGEARQVRPDGYVTGSHAVGTPHWSAPEIFAISSNKAEYGPFSDVYSVGVVFWELLTGFPPHSELDPYVLTDRLANGDLAPLVVPLNSPPRFVELMVQCWAKQVQQRPSAAQLLLALNEL